MGQPGCHRWRAFASTDTAAAQIIHRKKHEVLCFCSFRRKIMLKYQCHCPKWLCCLKVIVNTLNHFALLKGLTPLPHLFYQTGAYIYHRDQWATTTPFICNHHYSCQATRSDWRLKAFHHLPTAVGVTPHTVPPQPLLAHEQAGSVACWAPATITFRNPKGDGRPHTAPWPRASRSQSPLSKRPCKTDTTNTPLPSWQKDIMSGKWPPRFPTHLHV